MPTNSQIEKDKVSYGLKNKISNDNSNVFKPEQGRYHLYVSYACPFAHRALMVRALKGLEETISLSITHPTWQRTRIENVQDQHTGWTFKNEDDPPVSNSSGQGMYSCQGCIPDYINNAKFVRDLYEMSNNKTNSYSVPILWDKKLQTIVNNESYDISEILNGQLNEFAKNKELNLFPEQNRKEMNDVYQWVQDNISIGVFKCINAKTQKNYEIEVEKVFYHIDKIESILQDQKYLVGNQLTYCDIQAFTSLIRFDEAYFTLFKCNKKMIKDYTKIMNYLRSIYQERGVAETVNMDHIKTFYYSSNTNWNSSGIISIGPNFMQLLKER